MRGSIHLRRVVSAAIASLVVIGGLASQRVVHRFDGVSVSDPLGRRIGLVGDANQDGVDDIAIGVLQRVEIRSGLDGSSLVSIPVGIVEVGVGSGDVDADGFYDIVGKTQSPGLAAAWSGRDGSLIRNFDAPSVDDVDRIALVGDLDGDGFDDVAARGRRSGARVVVCFSGRDGCVLHSFSGGLDTGFGHSIAAAGDVDADGYADLIVGSLDGASFYSGHARVYSGRDGTLLHYLTGTSGLLGDDFAWKVSGAGDLDRDGHDDFLVGDRTWNSASEGAVFAYSGRTGLVLHALFSAVEFGAVGDVDGDGHPDIATAGRPIAGQRTTLHSGWSGAAIGVIDPALLPPRAISGFASAGDLDRDGFAEVVVSTSAGAGTVWVFDFDFSGTPGRLHPRGAGCLGSNGHSPRIGWQGDARVGAMPTIRLNGGRPNVAAVLLFGTSIGVPLDAIGMPTCGLYAGAWFSLGAGIDAHGQASISFELQPGALAIGSEFTLQWVGWDPGVNALGVTTSNALDVTIGG